MKAKTSAVLMLPSLTILAASLQAADVNPSWVEYTPVSASPVSDSPKEASATGVPSTSRVPVVTAAAPAAESPAPAAVINAEAVAAVPMASVAAQPVTEATTAPAPGGLEVTTKITPRIFAFDYYKGVDETLPHYLERYDYRKTYDGDTRSGVYADIDLRLDIENQERELLTVERRGFGPENHNGMAKFDDDEMTLSGSYSHYRSATGGIDYLYSPAVVLDGSTAAYPPGPIPNPPYYYAGDLPFTDQTGTTEYHIDRTTYAAGFKLKPSLLGGVTLAVDYEGYARDGNQLATTVAMVGGGPPPTIDSWRATNLNIDERMHRVGLSLSASPKGKFNVAYDAAIEKFSSGAAELTRNDILGTNDQTRQALSPFYFVPDTSLMTQSLRVSKNYDGRAAIAAGISHATLTDESSPERFLASFGPEGGPDTWNGEINSTSAYLTGSVNVSPKASVEGHIKYYDRENDSSFPVDHVISLAGSGRLTGPRIDSIDSLEYGLAGNWRPGIMGSSVTLGWQRLDRERGLTYRTTGEGIPANRIFYREDTLTDEIYLKWLARPAQGWTVRVTPSYTWADQTGLITEPDEALKVKGMLSYASPKGWLLSGFYDYKNTQNGDVYVTNDLTGAGDRSYQDVEHIYHAAGGTLNVLLRETVNTSLSLYWMQNDLANYFFTTSDVRQSGNPTIDFYKLGPSSYKVDSYVAFLAADWHASDALRLSGSYTFTKNKGDTASGALLAALQAATGTIDARIDNIQHSVSLGADYSLNDKATLRANYIYDYYDDNAYSLLAGGVHTLALGVAFAM